MTSAKNILLAPKPSMPEPLPLEAQNLDVMQLTEDMLPDAISGFVFDVAKRSQCPTEYVAVSVIVALGSLIGRKYTLQPKQNDNWELVPNVWGALIGPPSSMKSPAMKAALSPLVALERDLGNKASTKDAEQQLLAKFQANAAKGKEKEAESLYAQGDTDAALALMKEAQLTDEAIRKPRFIVNDTTVEKLGELLNENPNGLLLARDELHGFLARIAREENQSERAFYLESFDGNGRFTYDRIGRGTIVIEHCIISLLGGIQPNKIANIIRSAMTGKVDDGFIQRMQLCVWPDKKQKARWTDLSPDAIALKKYDDLVTHFNDLKTDEGEPHTLRFSSQAQVLFTDWWQDLQDDIHNDDFHPVIQSHFGKYPKTIGALALIFQLCTGETECIDEPAMQLAIEWSAFLRSHALRLYSAVDKASVASANLLINRKDKLGDLFTIRDVRRKGWVGLKDNTDITTALEILLDHHHLIEINQGASIRGGRPTTTYRWNPAYPKLE